MYFIKRIRESEILRGFAFTTLWNGLSKVITVVVTLVCSNNLTSEGFGEFSYIRNTLNLIILVCAANFSGLAIKFTTESFINTDSLKKLHILFWFTITISFIGGLICLFIPTNIIATFLNGQNVAIYLKTAIIFLPIFILQPLLSAVIRGCKEFNLVGLYEFIISLLLLLFIIIGIKIREHDGAIVGLLSYYLFASFIGIFIIFKYKK